MTGKTVEAVARAIIKARFTREYGTPEMGLDMIEEKIVEHWWPRCLDEAEDAITAHLKILEEEGKRIVSEHYLQELVTNRKVYEG